MAHFGGRLEVVLRPLELEPVRVGEERSGLHAQQGIVGDRILAVGVVAVVRCQQRCVEPTGDLNELGVRPVLVGDPVVLDLDEEVVPPEDVLQAGCLLLGTLHVAGEQRLEHHAAQTTRGGDQPVVMAFEQLPVDSGLVVVALEICRRRQLHEVAVSLDRLGQEGQVVVELLATLDVTAGVVDPAAAHRPLQARFARHVRLGPDDGHDALVAAGLVEVEDPVHVPVVRDAQRGLPVGHRSSHQVAHPGCSVQHGELGVGVQMRKRPLRHRPSFRHVS